ncbi:MAG: MFS transporter [Treponema sp.]|nr:MFS transporter [Treponema sp.]
MENLISSKKTSRNGLIVVTLAIFTDMLVYGLVVPILPEYAFSLGVSQTAVGLLFGSYAIALFAATPVFGILSDKIGRKGPLLWGLLGLAGSTVLYAFASRFWMLVTARSLQGISAAITWTAGFALLADLFPSEERGKVMGIALSGQSVGTLIGPTIGGWLYQTGGYELPFLAATGLAVIDGLLRIFLIKDVPHKKSESIRSSLSLLKNHRLLSIVGVVIIGASIPCVLEPTLPLRLQRGMHVSSLVTGLLFAVPTTAYAISAPFIGSISQRTGHYRTMAIGLTVAAVSLPFIALADSVLIMAAALFFLGIGIGSAITPCLPEFADISQESGANSFGASFSIYNTAYSIGMMIGPTLGGILTNYLGFVRSYSAVAVIILVYMLIFTGFNHHKV